MSAGWVRKEVKIAVADTAENLHQVPSTGKLQYKIVIFNSGAADATVKASVNTVSAIHGEHLLCSVDKIIAAKGHYENSGEIADANDYVVVESDSMNVTFTLSGRQIA